MAIVLDASEPLGLADTLGTLFAAVVEGEAQSARTTVDFITEVGFRAAEQPESGPDELRTLSFRYQKLDEDLERRPFTLEIPLLALVPIPAVSVKSATFEFRYEITSAKPRPPDLHGATIPHSALDLSVVRMATRPLASIDGRIGKKPASGATPDRANLEVRIELERAPLAVGVERILEILEVAASDQEADEDA